MCCGVVCTTHSVAEEASVNEVVRAGLDDSAFTSDDIVHFDGAAAIAAHPACTGVGIGKPNGNVPDCLILLNNGEDIDGGDDGGGGGGGADDAAPDDDGLTVPHQCHLYVLVLAQVTTCSHTLPRAGTMW